MFVKGFGKIPFTIYALGSAIWGGSFQKNFFEKQKKLPVLSVRNGQLISVVIMF